MKRISCAAFSLLELLVVIAIISILGTIVAMNVAGHPNTAKIAAAKANIQVLKTSIARYQLDNGRIPTETQGLAALCEKPTIEPLPTVYPTGGYLDRPAVPLDPWQRMFVYSVSEDGSRFEIISYGADGEPGGIDVNADLSSSEL
jgi:general secretion pathway protein G